MLSKFLALSRSTHGVLDIAMAGFAALLWLGAFPPLPVLAIALVTALAGYTAIYALNDLVAVKADREKFAGTGINPGYSVEASALRYPIAQGKLSFSAGLAWFAVWYLVALLGAWWLNPFLVVIVLAAPALEIVYCRLLKITWWRVLVSGFVKSLGRVAAVLAVVPRRDPALLALMVAWLICWEIGGQNIPADWNDVEEDRRVGAKTIPLTFGPTVAARAVIVALVATIALSLALPAMSPLPLGWPYLVATLAAGIYLLLLPGLALARTHGPRNAARLFDRASLYPLVQLVIVTAFVLVRALK